MQPLISEHGVAMQLGLTDAAVSRMVRRNEIPVVVLPNGTRRFNPLTLAAWIRGLERQPTMLVGDRS